MPKRTNAFQKLVFLVKTHVAAGATVTESKPLLDLLTGEPREVDICIQSAVAGHDVIVSIECNSKGRKAHVGWVEEMKAKHERLPTSALVLISRSGFSREAAEVAKKYGIHAFALNSVTKDVASRLFAESGSLWSKAFSLNPLKVLIKVPAIEGLPAEQVSVSPENTVYLSDGEEIGSARQLVERLFATDAAIREFGQLGEPDHKSFFLEWTPPEIDDGRFLCLQKVDPLLFRRVEKVRIEGSCNFNVSEFRLKHGELAGVTVAWGTSTFLGEKALLVASEHDGTRKISITTEKLRPNFKGSEW